MNPKRTVVTDTHFWKTKQYKTFWKYGDIEKDYFKRNRKLEKEIYLTAGDKEYGDMLSYINNFLERTKKYRIKTLDYEEFEGTHSGYVKPMLRKSLLKFYKK